MVAAGNHYGVTITTCVPADPESKGGSEATVRIAKADLVPTDTNLRDGYESWSEQVEACEAFMARVNGRPHRVTRRQPAEMLSEEQQRLHRLPEAAFMAAFGETRKVTWSSTISYGGSPFRFLTLWSTKRCGCGVDGDEIVAIHVSDAGAVEVARHERSTPGSPRIDDAHYPPPPAGRLNRQPKVVNPAELWLIETAAAGTARVKIKMAEAVPLAHLHGAERVDWALGHTVCYQISLTVTSSPSSPLTRSVPSGGPAKPTRCSHLPAPGNTSAEAVTTIPPPRR
jgi:hypothetical protein